MVWRICLATFRLNGLPTVSRLATRACISRAKLSGPLHCPPGQSSSVTTAGFETNGPCTAGGIAWFDPGATG